MSEHSLETLLEWSRGRWMADFQEQADQIKQEAIKVLKKTTPDKTLERNETDGTLRVVTDEEATAKLLEEERKQELIKKGLKAEEAAKQAADEVDGAKKGKK